MTQFDPWADYDQSQETAESGGSYKPLPAGERELTIYEHDIVPYSKKEGSPYAGLYALSVTLRVPDDEEFGSRRVFDRVPLFPKSPPNSKGESYVQYGFFGFFTKALGWDNDKLKAFAGKIRSGDIAGASAALKDIDGTRISAVLSVKPADEYNPEGSNGVKRYGAASGAKGSSAVPVDAWAAAPSTKSAPAEDPWGAPKVNEALQEAALASSGF